MDNHLGSRVFLALFPDDKTLEATRDVVRSFKKEARNLRFLNLDQMHITLQFLGNSVSNDSIEYISEELERHKSELSPQVIRLTDVMFGFPGQRIPKLIYWDVESTNELKTFTRDVHGFIKDLELPDINPQKDHAKLIHHMTLGRVKNSASKSLAKNIKSIIQGINIDKVEFKATELAFVSSTLTNTGPVYRFIKKVSF